MICFRDISNRVTNGRNCWAWQIQTLAFMLHSDQARGQAEGRTKASATNSEAMTLMGACQMDILDLFPTDQKLLTEIAWDCIQKSDIAGGYYSATVKLML